MKFEKGMSEEAWKKLVNRELMQAKRATVSAWRCFYYGRVSMIQNVNVLFGIDKESVMVGKSAIEQRLISPLLLEDAQGNGEKLTKLMGGSYKFQTIFDK